jgi:asparagine synthase (glutamine-hydrolysing)
MFGSSASESVRVMNDMLTHRGPDDGGYCDEPSSNLSLGMRRLSILDLEFGHQPMSNQDGSIWIVYNGEIFNSPELRHQLERQGQVFVTDHSDTEILLHLYEQKQEDMLSELNGMFSFVVYDKRRNLLFGARDRLGIKPFYYTRTGNVFAFASELKSLLRLPGVTRTLNRTSLFHYMTLRFVPGEMSIFDGIQRLSPAHWFRHHLASGRFETHRYWTPSTAVREGLSLSDWSELVRAELQAAVRRWTLSDVPIGCSLSGGLDSSSIVALLAEAGHPQLKTYSLGFGKAAADLDELPLARKVAERWGTEHHELVIQPDDLLRDLLKMVWYLDEPYGGGLPSWYVFQFMAHDVKVGMTGTGGDELFGDYGRYIGLERAARQTGASIPMWVKSHWHLVAALIDHLPHEIGGIRKKERWRNWPTLQDDSFKWEYAQAFYYCSDAMKRRDVLTENSVAGSVQDTVELLRDYYNQSGNADPRDAVMRLALETQLPEEFLLMTDRFSMAHSLEARVPFLDHAFVELACSIPPSLRTKPSDPKYLLREAVKDLLPAELLKAPKRGFVLPTAQWLRKQLRPLTERLLAPNRLAKQGIFRTEFYAKFVKPHLEGRADYHQQVWTALMFQLWHVLFMEERIDRVPDVSWEELC